MIQSKKTFTRKTIPFSPPQILATSFFLFILLGTCLLKLPFATNTPISWLDALFTATSASTVTGLNVVDPGSTYTLFGQLVIIMLIQIGGLGIMSFALIFVMLLGKKIGMKERLLVKEALNMTEIGGILKLVKRLFIYTASVELCIAVILSLRFIPQYGFIKGVYYSLFHSISSFNNAGFALWPNNLMSYVGDPIVNLAITTSIILGGLGFTVAVDIWNKRRFKTLSLHSKLMIIGTISINVIATLVLFCLEYANPHTLSSLHSSLDQWLAAYFQAVTSRTAGFNTIDIGGMNQSSLFFMIVLMFIGAGSASTGGGIKVTTFLVIVFSVLTFLKGKKDPVVFERTIKKEVIFRSLAIAVISLCFIFIAMFILTITEHASFLTIFFEVVSAFGTVGLSMNFSPHLTTVGRLVIVFMMFLGKVGPLTLVFSLAKQKGNANIRYPDGEIMTG